MKFSLILPFTMMALATISLTTDAFVPSSSSLQRSSCFVVSSFPTPRYTTNNQVKIQQMSSSLSSSSSSADSNDPTVDTTPMEPGSHDELMYALGVNLARQLGDVRPLVENGDELASVAKGLLDTVIGRLSEDGQRNLLAQRGHDLNDLISARA
jgi:hypothetical protein